MNPAPLHAIIVAYHGAEALERCLAGLGPQLPVIVVDNSSSTDVAAVVNSFGATYVDSGRNRGFAGGVNLALRLSGGERGDVLLVNPDAVIMPEAVAELVRYLKTPSSRRTAAVSPHLVNPAGHAERVVWPFPSPARMWAEAFGFSSRRSGASFLVGAVLLLRREAIEDVGLFDERFFLYAEEADWQRRAYQRGWTSEPCSTAVAQHLGGGTSLNNWRREALFHAAQETYIRKWFGTAGWRSYRFAACVGGIARVCLLTKERRAMAAKRTFLYLYGPRRYAFGSDGH